MINFNNFDIEEKESGIVELKNISPEFYDFLVSNNKLKEWVINLENDDTVLNVDTHNSVSYFLKNNDSYKYISCAFFWSHTPEGWDLWDRLNTEWIYKTHYK